MAMSLSLALDHWGQTEKRPDIVCTKAGQQ